MVVVGGCRDSAWPRSSVSRAAVGERFTRKCRSFNDNLLCFGDHPIGRNIGRSKREKVKGAESLTRTLPVAGLLTPEAVEMPFDALPFQTIQPQTGGKVNDEIPNLAPHGEMVTTQWRGGADVQLVRDPLAVSSMSRRQFLAFSPTRLGQPCLSASTARLKSSLAFPQSRFTPLPS